MLWGSLGENSSLPFVWQDLAPQGSPFLGLPEVWLGRGGPETRITPELFTATQAAMWDDSASSSPLPFPERLSAEARKLGEERAGCVQPGEGTHLFCFPRGREGSLPGMDKADKALWE